MADIDSVKYAHEQQLMEIQGVEGVGVGVDDIGNPAIVVYVNSAGVQKLLPQQIEGFKVKVENLKGPITVLPAGH
jgi:hypothetical protein